MNVTPNGLQLRPTAFSATWLAEQARQPIFTFYPRFLAHLILKGHAIWAQDNPDVYLDGDLFGVPVSVAGPSANVRLPSGDNRRGGTLDLWFWLVHRPVLAAIQITPTELRGGVDTATLQVSLAEPDVQDVYVALTSSNYPILPVPPWVIIPAGQTVGSVEISPVQVDMQQSVTVTATVDEVAMPAAVTVLAYRPELTMFQLNPATVSGNQQVRVQVGIQVAERYPVVVTLQSSNPQAFPVPNSIVIPAGRSNAEVLVYAALVYVGLRIEVTATLGDTNLHSILTLRATIG